MANAKFVEWEKRYTWGTAIEVTPNKVINLLLRAENNLLHVNDDNELYCDLQIANWIKPTDDFEVGVTTGTVQASDGRPQNWLLLHYEVTSWAYAQWLCWADGKIYFDNWTGTFKKVYYSEDVDALIAQLRSEISAVGYSGEYDDLLNRPWVAHISYSEEQSEWIVEGTLKDNTMVMITPFNWTVPPTLTIDDKSFIVLGNEGQTLNVYGNDPLVWIYQIDKTNNDLNYISLFLRKPDTALSDTSTNTVENKVVKAALDLKANDADISTVGKSNNYNDLDNKPTIWAGTTTINVNNSEVGTINANQTGDNSINIEVPTATSDITNDSGFITNQVNDLQNYMPTTQVQAGLESKVNNATEYNMTSIWANEDGSLTESFVNWTLPNTLVVVKNALDKLYLRKANKNDTEMLANTKADITYVNELVWSSLGIQTTVVDELPAVWSSSYIYLVETATGSWIYTKYVWDSSARDYIDLWTTAVDMSNYVTLDWTQTISWAKTFSTEPTLPANTAAATNVNTKAARESQVYQVAQDLSSLSSTVESTYATVQELEQWLNEVSWDVWAGILTIQKNWANVATFWANQKTNQTANIEVPTNTNQLTNGAGFITKDVNNLTNYTPTNQLPWTATSTKQWLVKLGSDTVQTVAANAVTNEWSRTYAVQLNGNGQAVVNVPWTDTIQAVDDRLDNTSLNPVQNLVITNALAGKQATLVNQSNIKSVNNNSLLGSWNLNINDVKISATEPSSPTAWMVWYDTANNLLKSYNGTAWSAVGAVLSVNWQTGNVTVQATLSNITSSEIKTGTATTQKSVTAAALAWALPVLSTQANNVLASWMKIRAGTEANYNALSSYDNNTLYLTY